MQRFLRTVPGKTTLFLATILSLCLAASCILGVFAMVSLDFYTTTREEIQNDYLRQAVCNDAYDLVRTAAWHDQMEPDSRYLPKQDTLLHYVILNADGEEIARAGTPRGDVADYPFCYHYGVNASNGATSYFGDGTLEGEPLSEGFQEELRENNMKWYTFCAYLDEDVIASGAYDQWSRLVDFAYSNRYSVIVLGVVFGVLSIFGFVALMCVSGRRPEVETLVPGPMNWVPSDLIVLGGIGILGCGAVAVSNIYYYYDEVLLLLLVLGTLTAAALFLGLCMSVACRIKQHNLLRNTVTWWACRLCWRAMKALWRGTRRFVRWIVETGRKLPLVWRTCAVFLGICFLELLAMAANGSYLDIYLSFWFVEHLILAGVLIGAALALRELKAGGEALAAGDLSYQVDTRRMYWDFKRHGENLNSIAGGMTHAVEQRMKSERMKTELITNVSHDIKTPLTSIINYADLIGREKSDNPKIAEYAEVLGRQSDRLKRLIEDLVEASKASTGNLEVLLAPCEAENFLVQIAGEYEKKLADAGLELITKIPEQQALWVMADGRRMLRVFDNLMNNICKYAQRGTRVYLTLEERERMAQITFRNTSRAPLNLSAEELMERFVQGDASRSGDGNGLGLSIARSLTELQNGSFQLDVDGDLFKVTLRFPLLDDGRGA